MDLDFIKELATKGFAVLKTGFGVLTSEFNFLKYLYTYGKHFIGMAKALSENGENAE